jgi:phage terminase large subunit GpA-like protein
MQDLDYEGAAEIERAWREGLTPDPLLSVSEWSDRHRMLSSKASAEPGRWRTSRTPYLKTIMDCLSPTSPIERVVFMKAAQLGATEMGSNWIGYVIHHAPGPMMIVQPSVEMAKWLSKHRLESLITETPVLAQKFRRGGAMAPQGNIARRPLGNQLGHGKAPGTGAQNGYARGHGVPRESGHSPYRL